MKRSGLRVAVVGTSLDILGGQGVQACRLIEGLEARRPSGDVHPN